MSAKRFSLRCLMIVSLTIAFMVTGCATTSSQHAQYNSHKPQMITADGVEEVGSCKVEHTFAYGIRLSDPWADALTVMGPAFQILGQLLACH